MVSGYTTCTMASALLHREEPSGAGPSPSPVSHNRFFQIMLDGAPQFTPPPPGSTFQAPQSHAFPADMHLAHAWATFTLPVAA